MYYDDEGRRFNVLSGLLFGTLLGAGVALLIAPGREAPRARPLRKLSSRRTRGWKRTASREMRSARDRVLEVVASTIADAMKQARAR